MYERDVGTGTVGWNPTHIGVAAEVMADHPDCPEDVSDDVKDNAPFTVDEQTAVEIQHEYRRRVEADPDINQTPE